MIDRFDAIWWMNEWFIYSLHSKHKTQQHPHPHQSVPTQLNKKTTTTTTTVPPFYFGFFLNIFTFALFLNKTRTRDTRSSKSFVEYYNTSLPITTTYQSHITSSSHQEDDDDDDYDDDNDDDEMMIWRMCIQKLEWSRRDVSDQWTRSSTTNLFEREWKSNTHTHTHTHTPNNIMICCCCCCCVVVIFKISIFSEDFFLLSRSLLSVERCHITAEERRRLRVTT